MTDYRWVLKFLWCERAALVTSEKKTKQSWMFCYKVKAPIVDIVFFPRFRLTNDKFCLIRQLSCRFVTREYNINSCLEPITANQAWYGFIISYILIYLFSFWDPIQIYYYCSNYSLSLFKYKDQFLSYQLLCLCMLLILNKSTAFQSCNYAPMWILPVLFN